jgi:alpha-1,2-glucosyltransferase
LPQLLYLWAFIAFFSAPILLPSAFSLLASLTSPISALFFGSRSSQPDLGPSSITQRKRRVILTLISLYIALILTCLIIKYNTIIHPFTLADNRHYVFYIFRYTILRHPLIRFLLAPAYILCFYLTYLALSIRATPVPPQSKPLATRQPAQNDGPKTSFLLIFILSTALSLITAPLVEPRYFIIPWVMWRLHVPAPSHSRPSQKKIRRNRGQESTLTRIVAIVRTWLVEGSGVLLWGETFWFLLINAVTGYVFLYRGFEWPQEPGKVQRFMW